MKFKTNGVPTSLQVDAHLSVVDRADSIYSLSITSFANGNFLSIYTIRDYKRNRFKFLPVGDIVIYSADTTLYTVSYQPAGTRLTYTAQRTFPGRNDTLVFTRFDDRVLAGRVQFKAVELERKAPSIEFTDGEFWIDLQKK